MFCVNFQHTSAILMMMIKIGGGKQFVLSRYLSLRSAGSIQFEIVVWNLSQHVLGGGSSAGSSFSSSQPPILSSSVLVMLMVWVLV